jgi:adenylosuccinate synthase
MGEQVLSEPPLFADAFADVEPIYEEMPGWRESTVGITDYALLPAAARAYLERLQQCVGVPIDIVSTGPDRGQTIVLRHPFE